MKIRIPKYGIVITFNEPVQGEGFGGEIVSGLDKYIKGPDNKIIADALESMILTHAIEGISVDSEKYIAGICSALDVINQKKRERILKNDL
jgi:hypothetical protein